MAIIWIFGHIWSTQSKPATSLVAVVEETQRAYVRERTSELLKRAGEEAKGREGGSEEREAIVIAESKHRKVNGGERLKENLKSEPSLEHMMSND